MKATDLLIGDWVRVYIEDDDPTQCGYVTCRVENINDFGDVGARGDDYREENIEPVELTADILEKNGYKDNGGLMYIQYLMEKDGRCRVSIIEASGGYQVMVNSILCSPKAIHYVHELQHALKLCKIEKEIIL